MRNKKRDRTDGAPHRLKRRRRGNTLAQGATLGKRNKKIKSKLRRSDTLDADSIRAATIKCKKPLTTDFYIV
jgi:hypothetical protein